MTQFEWTAETLQQLKKQYKKAVDESKDSFMFNDEHHLQTSYAQYLIEYLQQQNLKTSKNNNMNKVIYQGKEVETEDCTPTWEAIMPMYISTLINGETESGRQAATAEIMKLARAYDTLNAFLKDKVVVNVKK